MKLLSTILLTWAGITVGGFALASLIVLLVETYEKAGWVGIALNAAVLSGVVALPAGLILRCKG